MATQKDTYSATAVDQDWTTIIQPQTRWFDLRLDELLRYSDLIKLFVWRDFVAVYKQTVLGPVWHFIKPLFTTIVFTVVFGNIAGISTDGVPPFLFYMSGTIIWNYFSSCLTSTSNTFIANAGMFGKVYFPRLAVPVSILISKLISFGIQFLFFLTFLAYYYFTDAPVKPNAWILATPFLLLIMAGLGLGFGVIVSALTTRYRDLVQVVSFGVSLLMYATPIVYPLSVVPSEYRLLVVANPMTAVVETFRYAFLGSGGMDTVHLAYSSIFTLLLLLIGIALFNRVERTFMDTV